MKKHHLNQIHSDPLGHEVSRDASEIARHGAGVDFVCALPSCGSRPWAFEGSFGGLGIN